MEVWNLLLPPLTNQALSLSVNYMDRPVEQPGLYPTDAYRVGSMEQLKWLRFLADWSIPANGNGCSGGMLPIEEYRLMAEAVGFCKLDWSPHKDSTLSLVLAGSPFLSASSST